MFTLSSTTIIETLDSLSPLSKAALTVASLVFLALTKKLVFDPKTTSIPGPESESWISGRLGDMLSGNRNEYTKKFYAQYGHVFTVPWIMGSRQIVLCDPKAVGHFYARDSLVYGGSRSTKKFQEILLGKGLTWAEKEDHRRQRRALGPAFTNNAIRALTQVFFNSAYKLKANWDKSIDASGTGQAVIDVEDWMNRIALDSIGLAGFSHDFHMLDGQRNPIADAFDNLAEDKPSLSGAGIAIANLFPGLLELTGGERVKKFSFLKDSLSGVAADFLVRVQKEAEKGVGMDAGDRSVIGLLIKSSAQDATTKITEEEVLTQMNTLLLAGYETTSISLTWALIELCRNPSLQDRLRKELLDKFPDVDPTWDQITNNGTLPFLDAIVHETLRLYPAVLETTRVAMEDDIIPLSRPITTTSGKVVDSIFVKKGTSITAPIGCLNTLEDFWGPDATAYRPDRWMENEKEGAVWGKELKNYRGILTFSDGPRLCLGKPFALAEFKSVLSVLIRNFTFALPDGPKTELETIHGLLKRPRSKGQTKAAVIMKVGRVVQ